MPGDREDLLFANDILGQWLAFSCFDVYTRGNTSGLLSFLIQSTNIEETGLFNFYRAVLYQIISIYPIRMAGVFMITMRSIGICTALMNRGWTFLTYALTLVLP
jgi:hypothetical protein